MKQSACLGGGGDPPPSRQQRNSPRRPPSAVVSDQPGVARFHQSRAHGAGLRRLTRRPADSESRSVRVSRPRHPLRAGCEALVDNEDGVVAHGRIVRTAQLGGGQTGVRGAAADDRFDAPAPPGPATALATGEWLGRSASGRSCSRQSDRPASAAAAIQSSAKPSSAASDLAARAVVRGVVGSQL